MSVSVILVAYNGDKWISSCLDSLASASGDRLHVILVDNSGNSMLDSLDLGAFTVERLKTSEPLGFAEANNFALVSANRLEKYILFLNQDTISQPGWIDSCVDRLAENPERGAVSPLILNYSGSEWDPNFLNCISDAQKKRLGDESWVSEDKWMSVEPIPAPALLVRKDVLLRVGPFDPLYGSYYEDYDLCARISKLGFQVGFSTDSRIRHFSGSSTDTRQKELLRMRQIIRNRVIYNVRISVSNRFGLLLRHFCVSVPRNFIRGFLKRPGSQPPGVTFRAAVDVTRLSGRLMSPRKDQLLWIAYLNKIGWDSLA